MATKKQAPSRLRGFIFLALAAIVLFVAVIVGYIAFRVLPNVPALDAVTDYRPKIPLRVYTADNVLIGEFGEEHRDFVPIKKIPDLMKKSLLAIEDARFYEHGAIDFQRGIGAVVSNLRHGFGAGGGSTITMQVARNFFLSREKHLSRKVNEIALAYKIEAALSKDEILELYMNQIYLGQRAYGFASAARAYFNKNLDQLSVAEMAMLAGLPQNPSRHNPVANPKRARERQHAVLGRMRALNYITESQYQAALEEPLRVNTRGQEFDTHAEYVAELARQAAYAQFKDEAYTRGIRVTTTILKAEQEAAYAAVRRNVIAYDQRHGWRGPEGRIELPEDPEEREDAIADALGKRPSSDGLVPAVVLSVTSKSARVETEDGETVDLSGAAIRFAQAGLNPNAREALRLSPGAIIRVSKEAKGRWTVTQVPQVAAAFVAIDADSGAYHALVGGFDYNFQKFNHVTQAWRQPGSGMKPFVYSAALEKGYSPATRILDAPLDLPGEDAGKTWSPQNDDGKWDGPITMRRALAESKNVPSVRLLRSVSVPFAHEFIGKFGFDLQRQPKNFTLALGTGAVTPLQMAGAYAVFANGGYQVQPYLIARIEDADGKVIQQAAPPAAHNEEQRVLDARNAFITDSMLRDVTRYGTGAAATKALNRTDIAGKTGTTSDAVDGWFSGYGGNVVAVAWMGYDDPRSLGGREFGATLALPIWIDYMKVALAKRPQEERTQPEGLVRENDDWVYTEYAETPVLGGIDLDQQPAADPNAPPADPNAPPQQAPSPQQTQLQNSLF
ncbi:penicillin-binding protein 1A [Herbaspirillum sp. SJZ107]|uniref:penicillin-binding protein 1A n=1 Tax=Herbaspirillum sp. SJZ107 TaxID=2572881 RepID=UPI00114EAC4A|nr:penicillin-binding protein 1A [Herbaspirillum sp. SJZ107]TQK11240.1 penicillin-binding protein 1A [Herbaspirillum sp. SJZ107]